MSPEDDDARRWPTQIVNQGEFIVSIQNLKHVRDRILPMMEVAADQYQDRVPEGYPNLVDNVDQGLVGLELDPSYALYLTSEGEQLYAEVYRRQSRTDARSSSSRQKYGGLPFQDRRPIPADIDDQALRNLIGEIKHAFNMQPGMLYITED